MKITEILSEAKAVKQRLDPKCWKGKHKEGTKVKGGVRVNNCVPNESVAEGSLNEFAPDGFNGGDDNEGFSPEIAKMAQEDGFTKGVGLADGATLERAMKINYWHTQHGGMYKQYFAKGFKQGRMNKVKHDNRQYNLNLKLMKDGSIRHGEQGVAEGQLDELFEPSTAYYTLSNGKMVQVDYKPGIDGQSPAPFTDVKVSYVDPALKPQGASFDSTGRAERWDRAPDGVKQAIQKFITQPQKDAAEDYELDRIRQLSGLANEDFEQQFDLIEEMVEALAEAHGVDSEVIWEDFESVDDIELLDESAAWKRKAGKSKTGGLNKKGVASYRRENPGSKLQTAVTTKPSKLKKGSKAAKRRKSFCARMGGMKGAMKKPNGKPTRKALALRKWNC
jgi:hypothetical protein